MGLKDIFTSIKTAQKPQQDNIDNAIVTVSDVSWTAKGAIDAGKVGGTSAALLPNLHATYLQITNLVKQDKIKQDERRIKIQEEINILDKENLNLANQIQEKRENLEHEGKKIEEKRKETEGIRKEINKIKENPKSISGDSSAKASFWIGFVIIVFLTVYLFVFYSSASYSAFFKDFTPDDTKITQAIFDAQAIRKALADGFTELIFILAIPAVFLGLGFLIHKFSEEKGVGKYLKISGLVVVTFIFDFIIAYAIVREIHEIGRQTVLHDTPPAMTLGMAFQDVNFWIIIFAGFVVYIIWGLVFSFTMSEYEKMDIVRITIRNLGQTIQDKEQKSSEYKRECKDLKEKISNLDVEKNTNQGKIDNLTIKLQTSIIYLDDVTGGISDYFAGWLGFMQSAKLPQNDINDCTHIKNKFLDDIQNSDFMKANIDTKTNIVNN